MEIDEGWHPACCEKSIVRGWHGIDCGDILTEAPDLISPSVQVES